MADRQALLAEQEAEARRRQEDDIESFEITGAPAEETEAEEEDGEEDSGEDHVEMAPLVPLDVASESEDTAHSSDEEDDEDVFVNHGGAEQDHDDELPQTKPEAAIAALNDYHGDPEIAAAEAAEENEGEIEPVSAGDGAANLVAQWSADSSRMESLGFTAEPKG